MPRKKSSENVRYYVATSEESEGTKHSLRRLKN
jgi:hypothetical protein